MSKENIKELKIEQVLYIVGCTSPLIWLVLLLFAFLSLLGVSMWFLGILFWISFVLSLIFVLWKLNHVISKHNRIGDSKYKVLFRMNAIIIIVSLVMAIFVRNLPM